MLLVCQRAHLVKVPSALSLLSTHNCPRGGFTPATVPSCQVFGNYSSYKVWWISLLTNIM